MEVAMTTSSPETTLDGEARAAVTVGAPADDLHALWLRPDTQSRIWSHFADLTPLDEGSVDWLARGPTGGEYRWRTRIEDSGTDEISWSSAEGADVANAGRLRFRPAPGDRGTECHLHVRFDPPGGMVGQAVGKLFHIVPDEIVRKALYKFRALATTGEIPTTDPQPAARDGGIDK
jgi:uncharacterized membrane protein